MTPKKSRSEPSLRQRALNLLGRREYSARELTHRLAALGHDVDEIGALVTDFEQRGWLSDARFAAQVVRARSTQYGARRIAQELREKGVDPQTIAGALQDGELDEMQMASALWQKKFGTVGSTPQEKARQIRYLQSRGFALGLIFKIVGAASDDEGLINE